MTELQIIETGSNNSPVREHVGGAALPNSQYEIQQAAGTEVSGSNDYQMNFDVDAAEWREPLERLPPGRWISSGGYFNYEAWPDRARFIELDRAIALRAMLAAERCRTQKSGTPALIECSDAPSEFADLQFLLSPANFIPIPAGIRS